MYSYQYPYQEKKQYRLQEPAWLLLYIRLHGKGNIVFWQISHNENTIDVDQDTSNKIVDDDRSPDTEWNKEQHYKKRQEKFYKQHFQASRYNMSRPVNRRAQVDPGSLVIIIECDKGHAVADHQQGHIYKPEKAIAILKMLPYIALRFAGFKNKNENEHGDIPDDGIEL